MNWLKNRLSDVGVLMGAAITCSLVLIGINFDVYLKLLDLFWWLQD